MPMAVPISVKMPVSGSEWYTDLKRSSARQVNSTDKGLEAIIFTAEVHGRRWKVLLLVLHERMAVVSGRHAECTELVASHTRRIRHR